MQSIIRFLPYNFISILIEVVMGQLCAIFYFVTVTTPAPPSPPVRNGHHQRFGGCWIYVDGDGRGYHQRLSNRRWWRASSPPVQKPMVMLAPTVGDGLASPPVCVKNRWWWDINTAGSSYEPAVFVTHHQRFEPAVKTFFPSKKIYSHINTAPLVQYI